MMKRMVRKLVTYPVVALEAVVRAYERAGASHFWMRTDEDVVGLRVPSERWIRRKKAPGEGGDGFKAAIFL